MKSYLVQDDDGSALRGTVHRLLPAATTGRDGEAQQIAGEYDEIKRPTRDIDSRYMSAPDWRWTVAGCTISALHVLFFLVAWLG